MNITDHIINLATRLNHWGLVIIFIVVMLECLPLLGLFAPGESLVLVGGFLASQDVFELDALITTLSLAAITGDTISFELGRRLGIGWIERHGKRFGIGETEIARIGSFLKRHGGKAAFFSHFMHLLRSLMPFMAGAGRMPYRRFAFSNAAGCILWSSVFSVAGYYLGESWIVVGKWVGRAGAVFGGLIVLAFLIGRLWTWMVKHEVALRSGWMAFCERPAIAGLRRRFASQIEFLENRLTPGGYLGLHLTIGVLVVLLAAWWFQEIAEDLVKSGPLLGTDARLALWFDQHSSSGLTRIAEAATFLGSPTLLVAASVGIALLLWHRRAWYRLIAFVLTLGGGSLLNLALKYFFHRPRPVFENPHILASGWSFPSGHTMGAVLFYGFAAVVIATRVKLWRWQVLAYLVAFLLVILISFSRIYLGAHYLSDVMAAGAAGLAWLAFCLTGVEMLRRYSSRT